MPENSTSKPQLCPPENSARRAKIICTIGPSCNSEAALRELMQAGMDVARLNFSHGSPQDHVRRIETLRNVAAEEGRTICIMQDLQGPKIRTGALKDHQAVTLQAGGVVIITTREIVGSADLISTTFKNLPGEVRPGSRVLLSDGRIELRVKAVHG
ncbi:MAG: pyruvate kinase, partial [Acidobacteria bacterium]